MPGVAKKTITLIMKILYKQLKNCIPCLTILASILEGVKGGLVR